MWFAEWIGEVSSSGRGQRWRRLPPHGPRRYDALYSATSTCPLLPPAVHVVALCCPCRFVLLSAAPCCWLSSCCFMLLSCCPLLLIIHLLFHAARCCPLLPSAVLSVGCPALLCPLVPPSSSFLPPVVASLRLLLPTVTNWPRRSLSGTNQRPTSEGMWIYFPSLHRKSSDFCVSMKRNTFP